MVRRKRIVLAVSAMGMILLCGCGKNETISNEMQESSLSETEAFSFANETKESEETEGNEDVKITYNENNGEIDALQLE